MTPAAALAAIRARSTSAADPTVIPSKHLHTPAAIALSRLAARQHVTDRSIAPALLPSASIPLLP